MTAAVQSYFLLQQITKHFTVKVWCKQCCIILQDVMLGVQLITYISI